MSVREIVVHLEATCGKTYKSGTLTNFLGRHGLLRSKQQAHKLALQKARRVCELCNNEHTPRNWNQRWCDACTSDGKQKRRVRNHGLPAAFFDSLFEKQQHKCKICKREFETCLNERHRKTLFVDHNHETNQVRGLLCPRCNNGMSYVDDKKWLTAALDYIKESDDELDKVSIRPPRRHVYVRNSLIIKDVVDQ